MKSGINNILIFYIGALGDTLVSVPLFKKIRQVCPKAEITILSEQFQKKTVRPSQILNGTGLIDKFISYKVSKSRFESFFLKIPLYFKLLKSKYDIVIYLVPSVRAPTQIARDKLFFKLIFPKEMLGFKGPFFKSCRTSEKPLPNLKHESELVLKRFQNTPLEILKLKLDDFAISVSEENRSDCDEWFYALSISSGKLLITVGIGAEMASKRWPVDNYINVLEQLISKYDLYPIFLGGPEDRQICKDLSDKLGRGWVAAGDLNIQSSIEIMKKCLFYLGNDTGTMHMAVSAGLPCVAIFSARDYPGKWYPFGENHKVFRNQIDCQGCMLVDCESMDCLNNIAAKNVFEGCCEILEMVQNNQKT